MAFPHRINSRISPKVMKTLLSVQMARAGTDFKTIMWVRRTQLRLLCHQEDLTSLRWPLFSWIKARTRCAVSLKIMYQQLLQEFRLLKMRLANLLCSPTANSKIIRKFFQLWTSIKRVREALDTRLRTRFSRIKQTLSSVQGQIFITPQIHLGLRLTRQWSTASLPSRQISTRFILIGTIKETSFTNKDSFKDSVRSVSVRNFLKTGTL